MPRQYHPRRAVPQQDKFYVYALFKPNDPNPFYIGKGKGKRVNDHFTNHNTKFNSPKNAVIKKYWDNIKREILCYFDKEEDAYSFEEYLIAYYGVMSEGGILTNYAKTKTQYAPHFYENVTSKAVVKMPKVFEDDEVIKFYDLFFRDALHVKEIEKLTGIPANYCYYLANGTKRGKLLDEYKSSGSFVDNRQDFIRCYYEHEIPDEIMLDAYQRAVNGESMHSVAESIGTTAHYLNGVFNGRKRKYLNLNIREERNLISRTADKIKNIELVRSLLDKGLTVKEIMNLTGFSKTGMYRYINAIKKDKQYECT